MSIPRHRMPAVRRQEMLRAVQAGPMHVAKLAKSFGVSEMTVRRDLRQLEAGGKLERVRGGAFDAAASRRSRRRSSSGSRPRTGSGPRPPP